MSVIIIDGPDGCGKTHIGKELARVTGIPYFKNNDEHKYFLKDPSYFIHAIRYVDTFFTSYLEASGVSVILDRSYPSEWVYSKVLNRTTDMDVLKELDERHSRLGTKIIIPYRNDYTSVNDDYDVVNRNIMQLHKEYMNFARWTQCSCLILNVDDEDLHREVSNIKDFLLM